MTITDPILDRPVVLKPDLLTLAVGGTAQPGGGIGEIFKVPRNAEGFLNEAHAKLRPVDLALRRPLPGGPGPLSQAHR